MCGIVGFAGFQDDSLLREMTRRLRHRGPDGEGYHIEPEASLGHRRLAILDIEGGAQPMSSPDGRVWVSFNGQIYNYQSIMKDFAQDYSFQTHCDTEILPILYQHHGKEMVHQLRGMFSFAIWDSRQKQLFLARDRIGVKPLYYACLGQSILFASEPKALLACQRIDSSLDPEALDAYVDLLYVPPPLSIFRGIRQLPPGHHLTWREGQVTIEKYWDALPDPDNSRSMQEWVEELGPIIEDSIRMRTISDVPLGAFLSGGIDSSTIVSVLAKHSTQPVETFCIGFGEEGKSYEERPIARRVAQFFGTNHHELEIHLDVVEGLDEIVRSFDEPFGNPTALLTSALSKFTRQFVTVSLAGDGGDEMFGGYPRYRGMLWAGTFSRFPAFARKWILNIIRGKESSTARNYRRWLRELLEGSGLPPQQRYAAWVGYSTLEEKGFLFSDKIQSQLRSDRPDRIASLFNTPDRGSDVQRAVYADLHGFLPENVLRYSDRMSMAHSLEVRVPFTDHVLAEQLMKVPSSRQVTHLAAKKLLKQVMKKDLPEEVLSRKKLGFNPPLGVWLQKDQRGLISEYLHPDVIRHRGLFRVEAIQQLIAEHQSHARDHGLRLWSLIVLEHWQRLYQDSRAA